MNQATQYNYLFAFKADLPALPNSATQKPITSKGKKKEVML
jgi:hypothetical protein